MSFNLGGTTRACPAEETLLNIKPYIELAGITRIANLTDLDCLGLPVYTCIRPLSKNLATSQGKGITHNLAKCSAYMEGIEHYFAENIPTDLTAKQQELDAKKTIGLGKLQDGPIIGKNREQYINDWHIGIGLFDDKEYYLPTNYISFDLDKPIFENGFFKKTTTGLASGNNTEEASVHALYENIERHAMAEFATMPYEEKLGRILDLDTIDYEPAKKLIDNCKEHHVDVVVFDATNEFNIPTYHAIIADENPFRKLGNYSGNGTHINAGMALCRALTEAAQSRVTYISGSRDDMFPEDYNLTWQPLKLTGERAFESSKIIDLKIHDQYDHILDILQKYKYQAILFDHAPDAEKISVVKIVIPGFKV